MVAVSRTPRLSELSRGVIHFESFTRIRSSRDGLPAAKATTRRISRRFRIVRGLHDQRSLTRHPKRGVGELVAGTLHLMKDDLVFRPLRVVRERVSFLRVAAAFSSQAFRIASSPARSG